jgi:hypothetical protein
MHYRRSRCSIATSCEERECGHDRGFQLRRVYKLALARAPKAVEMQLGEKFLNDGGTLADFCLALMNRNEFVYVP